MSFTSSSITGSSSSSLSDSSLAHQQQVSDSSLSVEEVALIQKICSEKLKPLPRDIPGLTQLKNLELRPNPSQASTSR